MTDIFFCKLPLSTPVTQEKTGPAHTDAIGSVWSALLSFMNSLHRLRNMQGERYSNIKTNKKLSVIKCSAVLAVMFPAL